MIVYKYALVSSRPITHVHYTVTLNRLHLQIAAPDFGETGSNRKFYEKTIEIVHRLRLTINGERQQK